MFFKMIFISCLRNHYKSTVIAGVLMRTDLNALSIAITNWLTFESDILNITICCREKEELTRRF